MLRSPAPRFSQSTGPVAVCTLSDEALARELAALADPGISIVGTCQTENLGIERIVQNVLANPNIRFLIVAGSDSRQVIGHLPGQSLVALSQNGTDERGRIIGARGKRPVFRNLPAGAAEHFRQNVEVGVHRSRAEAAIGGALR